MTRTPSFAPRFRDTLSAESLRWTMGLYCSFVGAFMMVAPHRFLGPQYQGLDPHRAGWGMLALAGGVALLAIAILRPRLPLRLLGHGIAAASLLALASSFSDLRLWTGASLYTVLGLGVLLGGALEPTPPLPDGEERGHDLFALLMGFAAVILGVLLVSSPVTLTSSYFDPARPRLLPIGVLLLLGGALLLSAQLRRAPSRRLLWAAHLCAGGAFFVYGALLSLPAQSWTGLTVYWGGGLALALLPGLSRRLAALDPSSLRTRLAFALATATSVALVLTAAVATTQEEHLAASQVLETRRIEAQSIARNVADYVQLNSARASVVATLAGRLPMESNFQRALLEASRPSYPDVAAFLTLDASGTVLASTGGVPLDLSDWRLIADELRPLSTAGLQMRMIGQDGHRLLLLSAAILRPDQRMAGVLVMVFEAELLSRRIARPGSNVYLADGYGRLIASQEGAESGPALPAGWDRELRAGRVPIPARRLAAFAQVPGLEWVVAVEKPRVAALSGVRRGRDLAFGLLLLVVPIAVAGGIVVARLIARPLGTLADAVGEMTAGNLSAPAAPLETSDITEVARLSAAFREMRDRLAARTRESERLATELRARAEALAETDRRKDEFLAMLAHELRNPLGAIANASYVLEQAGPAGPPMDRAVPVIQRQIQHLVRLVDDLLDVSRITRGKIELRKQDLDLRDAVRGALEMTRPLIEAKEHELRVSLPDEPLPLHADVTRLEQALGNLVRNAAKYTEPGGHIEVSARREDGEAVVRVKDDGIGISPELLPRIFDLFIQGEQSLDRSGGGLGIGLTLVRRLIEMHGGRVEARSAGPGQGSEFTVRLPLEGESRD
ncbi:MAG TPA: sensor histidine kinase [Thermoanaerobaculia bacterium]|nr:sensor histidine kinase [Thermoanaerobaculia bacterium]